AIKRISWIVERQPARKHGGGSRWPAELEKLCVAGSIPAGRSNLRHEVCGSGAAHRAVDGQNPLSFALNALVSTRAKSRVSEAHRRWHRLNPSDRDADGSKKLKFFKRRLPMNEMHSTKHLAEMVKDGTLNLAGIGVTDVSALAGLTELTTLILAGTQVADVRALAELTNLEWLNL